MKRFVGLLFVNLILVLLQLSFFGELFDGSFVPNLVLALAFAFIFCDLGEMGKTSAFLGGVFLDLLGFNIIGFSPITIISCILIYDLIRRNMSGNIAVSALTLFLATLIYDKIMGFSPRLFASEAVIGAMFTLGICGIFYVLVSNFSSYLARSGYKISE